MKVAALQMNAQDQVADNLLQAEGLVREAAQAGAKVVVLPEGFAFLGAEAEKIAHAETLDGSGPVMSALRHLASNYQVLLVGGGLAEQSSSGFPPYNTSAAIDPQGQLLAAYRKMHLFDVDLSDGTQLTESRATTRGTLPVVFRFRDVGIGLSICYDLRFPALYAWQRDQGAQVLTVPAAFTHTTGAAHWHVLLRARAIETQCFVVAAAQQGTHPHGRRTFGHAIIVGPWGEILAERSEPGPGVIVAELDLEQQRDVRRRMPIVSHRHPFFIGDSDGS
jgi:deaminated glutathione amidase